MPANRIGNNSNYSKRSETAEAINLLLDEMYIEDIAEALTLTPNYIGKIIRDNGWQYRAKHKPKSERTKSTLPPLMPKKEKHFISEEQFRTDCQTMTAKELTNKYDCTENSVYYWAKKYGCKPKRSEQPYKKKEVNMAYVKECLQLGITLAEVAEMVHVSTNTINSRLREEGLTVADIVRAAQHSDGTGYNCRPSAKTHDCKYWDHNCKCCDYLAKTGNRRPCPAWDCTVYEKGTRYKDKWSKSGF